jgi:hypothetical protein
VLVVIGHAILKLIAESDVAYEGYLFVYFLQVPLFIAVSGYFVKSGPPGTRQLHRILTDLVFPYVIFETFWTPLLDDDRIWAGGIRLGLMLLSFRDHESTRTGTIVLPPMNSPAAKPR